jgi:hypothetical protein
VIAVATATVGGDVVGERAAADETIPNRPSQCDHLHRDPPCSTRDVLHPQHEGERSSTSARPMPTTTPAIEAHGSW